MHEVQHRLELAHIVTRSVYLRQRRNIVFPKGNIVDAKHHIVYGDSRNIVCDLSQHRFVSAKAE